ncbi:uncharacterized protein LOC124258072 [Haliotis rubra]|uniref:uncharacterized protein LOC124258072 n=1 Tax=Haliotis rubra TaxID=36100 RepID=UPI001EE598D7|nr:uncharacterized protein LOC124258072 [Haliotis rubra]
MANHEMQIVIALYLCVYGTGIFGLSCDKGVSHRDVLSSCMTYNSLNSRQSALGETQRLLMGVVNQILAELDWSSVTVIFDDQTEMFVRSLSEAVEKTRVTECRLLHVPDSLHGNTSRHVRSKLLEFYLEDESHHKNFLVVCGGDCTVAVMEIANSVDDISLKRTYMRHHARWLLMVSDNVTSAVAKAASRLDHVTCILVPFDLNPVQETNISHTTSLRDIALPLMSLLWLPGRRNWSCVGHISGDKFVGEVFPNIPLGFNQRQFVITTMPWPGFVIKSVSGTNTTYSGFCMDLLKGISERLNFTYRLVEPADDNYGRVRNGRWTGLVGQLVRREVDFSVAGLSFTVGREAVIDYVSTALNYDFKDVVYRKIGSDEGKWRLLLDVYHPLVLGLGLATYLIVSLMLFSFLAAPSASGTSPAGPRALYSWNHSGTCSEPYFIKVRPL